MELAFSECSSDQTDIETNPFEHLPDDVVLRIFHFISPEEQRCILSAVCKHWFELVRYLIIKTSTSALVSGLALKPSSNELMISLTSQHKLESSFTSLNQSTGSIHFNQLPQEVILHIFEYISPYEKLHTVALVCHYWHLLVNDPILWRHLTLNQDMSADKIVNIIGNFPLLKVLNCPRLCCINEVMGAIFDTCPLIECLDIGFCQITQNTLFTIAEKGKNLRHLNVEASDAIDEPTLEVICTQLPQLTVLNLSHCGNVTDEAVCVLSRCLKTLCRLNVDGVQWLTDQGIVTLCEYQWSSLKCLWFDGFELTGRAIRALNLCKSLKLLSISFCENLTDPIALDIRSLDQLEVLTLRKAHGLSTVELNALFNPKESQLTHLKHLNLNECPAVDDSVVTAICELCGSSLLSLSLNWCWKITDAGITLLVENLRFLEWLSLVGNHGIRGQSLTQVPERMPRLRVLNLAQCNQIEDDLMQVLALRVPHMFIFNYYGERFGDPDDNGFQYESLKSFDTSCVCGHHSL